jgi:hypothetical protein
MIGRRANKTRTVPWTSLGAKNRLGQLRKGADGVSSKKDPEHILKKEHLVDAPLDGGGYNRYFQAA